MKTVSLLIFILILLIACGPTSPTDKISENEKNNENLAESIQNNEISPPTTLTVFNPVKSEVTALDPAELPQDVYALVNGSPLTDAEIDEKLAEQPDIPQNQLSSVRHRLASMMINQMIVSQIIKSGQLKIDPADLKASEERFDTFLNDNNWTREDFMQRSKMSEDQFLESLMMQAYFLSQVTEEKIAQKTEELQKHVEEARTVDVILKGGPSYKSDEKDKLKTEITQLRERALKGEDFTELAVKYSDDPSINQHNGRIGPVTQSSYLVPQLQKAIFDLKSTGDISEIIDTEMGFMLIKLIDIAKDSIKVGNGQVVPVKQMAENLVMQETQREFHELVIENNTIVRRPPPQAAKPPMPGNPPQTSTASSPTKKEGSSNN